MPIGARRCEAWVVIPKCPFVLKIGWFSFVSHDDVVDVQFCLVYDAGGLSSDSNLSASYVNE